ncbi:MAG: hypothetical protein RR893_03485 [Clostridia bacterium]
MKRPCAVAIMLVTLLAFEGNVFAMRETDGGTVPLRVERRLEDISGEELVRFENEGGTIIGNATTPTEVSAMGEAGLIESTCSPTGVVTVFYPAMPNANHAFAKPESRITAEIISTYQGEWQGAEQVDVVKGPVRLSDVYRFAAKRGWSLRMDERGAEGYRISDIKAAVAYSMGYDPMGADVIEKAVSCQIPAEQWVVGVKPGYTVTEFAVTQGDKILATGCAWRANGLIVQYEKHST